MEVPEDIILADLPGKLQ